MSVASSFISLQITDWGVFPLNLAILPLWQGQIRHYKEHLTKMVEILQQVLPEESGLQIKPLFYLLRINHQTKQDYLQNKEVQVMTKSCPSST